MYSNDAAHETAHNHFSMPYWHPSAVLLDSRRKDGRALQLVGVC